MIHFELVLITTNVRKVNIIFIFNLLVKNNKIGSLNADLTEPNEFVSNVK